jgi:hypothetical protein
MKTFGHEVNLPNNVSIVFGRNEEDADEKVVTGISGLMIDGVPLMDSSFPSSFILSGPDGWEYRRFRIVDKVADGDSFILKTAAIGIARDNLWIRDQYNCDIARVSRPRPVPELDVDFILSPANEIFGGREFSGFNISLRIHSRNAKLAKLEWRQHWEIGGSSEGNTLLHQSQISSPFHRMTLESQWSNVCWKDLRGSYASDNISMQYNSRCAYHQLFDFIYNKQGIFLAYFPHANSVQTLSQKNAGENNFFVFDALDFPLSSSLTLPWKTMLFSKNTAETDDIAAKNIWFETSRILEESYRKQTGIRKSRIVPTELDGMWETIAVDGKLCFGTPEKNIPSNKYLETLAKDKIPLLKEQGFGRFWTRPFCVSDTTEMMFWNKAKRGRGVMDGDVAFGSCCCVWEYKPSEVFGGGDAARKFYELGHQAGMEIGIWVGNHLSTKAPILRKHPEWILKDCSFDNPSGGYDSHVLAILNWNSGVRQWILDDILDWKKLYGLDFIFFDSLGNLGLKPRNFSDDALRDNFNGLCRFLAELTANGIEVICEGRSFSGSPYFAISNSGNMHSDNDPLIGQNSLSWFIGHEDMLAGIHLFTEETSSIAEKDFIEMNFKIVANGGILKTRGCKINEIFDSYRIFNLVSGLMHRRELLADNMGVLWRAENGTQLLFSYKTGKFPVSGSGKVRRVAADGIGNPESMNAISMEAHGVYIIE